jgi:hypothetical protein
VTTVITAPAPTAVAGFRVFLAGAIDMGQAVDWQAQVIAALDGVPGLVLINPRRDRFTPDMETEQIEWELDALEEADLILMWFPAQARAPVSFLETGLYLASGKLLVGAERGFYRRRNLELTGRRCGVTLHERLSDLVDECRERANQR